MDGSGTPSIIIIAVFKEAYLLYKKNIRILLYLSLLGLVTSVAQDTYSYLFKGNNSTIVKGVILIIDCLVFTWVNIALTNAVAKLDAGEGITFSSMFWTPSGKYLKAIGVGIVVGIAFVIYGVIFGFLFEMLIKLDIPNFIISVLPIIITFLIALIPVIYFLGKYLFVLTSIALENVETSSFANSARLVKGNFWRVLLGVSMVWGILYLFPIWATYIAKDFVKNISAQLNYFIYLIIACYKIFIAPFMTAFITLLYLRLKENKGKGSLIDNTGSDEATTVNL